MPLSEILLIPFKKYFKPPVVETPFSTIKMPSIYITVSLVFLSFFVIVGGFIFCYVNDMPLFGYARNQNGQIYQTWIDTHGIGSQLLAEGMLCSLTYSLGAASLIAAFYAMTHEKEKSDFVKFVGYFGCSTPIWMFLAFQIFRMKIPSYFPKFNA